MKKFILVLMILFVSVISAEAQKVCKSTGWVTSSYVLSRSPSSICGVLTRADGTNEATVIIYDDNEERETGKVIWPDLPAQAGEKYSGGLSPFIIKSDVGIYIKISGTGAKAIIYYDAQ